MLLLRPALDEELLIPSIVRSVVSAQIGADVFDAVDDFLRGVGERRATSVTLLQFSQRSVNDAEAWFREHGSPYQGLETARDCMLTERDVLMFRYGRMQL